MKDDFLTTDIAPIAIYSTEDDSLTKDKACVAIHNTKDDSLASSDDPSTKFLPEFPREMIVTLVGGVVSCMEVDDPSTVNKNK